MLQVTDPTVFEEEADAMFAKLRRRYIKTCGTCSGTGQVLGALEYEDDDDLVGTCKTKFCDCKDMVLFRLALFEAGVPKEFWEADTISPEYNRDKFTFLHKYANKINTSVRKDGLSLLMSGENGVGKTSSSAIAIIGAIEQGMKTAIFNWPDLVSCYRSHRFDAKFLKRLDQRLKRPFVVFDEIGKESALNGADTLAQQLLDSTLRLRRTNSLPTIVITNMTVADFVKRYGASIKSLVQTYRVLEYAPGDFRATMRSKWAAFDGEE